MIRKTAEHTRTAYKAAIFFVVVENADSSSASPIFALTPFFNRSDGYSTVEFTRMRNRAAYEVAEIVSKRSPALERCYTHELRVGSRWSSKLVAARRSAALQHDIGIAPSAASRVRKATERAR